MADGKRPLSGGFFFSFGHATIVMAVGVGITVAARAVFGAVVNPTSAYETAGGTIGTVVSAGFLYLIALLNLIVLAGIFKVFRDMRRGVYDEAELEAQLQARGLMYRFFGRFMRSISHTWQMYFVGMAFGIGFGHPTMASLELHGTAMGHHAKDLNIQSPGVIIVNVNFIAPLQQAMLKALQEEGIKPVDVEQVDITKADYSDIIVKMRAAGAKSILAGLDPFSYARMYQAMERQNFKVPVLGFGLDKKSANEAYGPAVDGSESLMPFKEAFDPGVANDPDVAEYFGAVQRYFPNQAKALDVYTEAQWVAAKVFVEALKRIPGAITRQSLVAALNTLKNYQPGLIPSITYGPGNHDPNHCFNWIRNQKGAWKTYATNKCF